jgi:predicted nucleic acid-binding Zn finger protein
MIRPAPTISERVARRAQQLLETRRVRLASHEEAGGQRRYGAVILGENGDYAVWFDEFGVTCDCYAGSDHTTTEPRCCHAVAAMVAWAEILDLIR